MPSLYYKNDSTWEQIQLVSFPVGAIYMSYTSTSPASFIGGSWIQIQERFLLAAGSKYDAGDTGGETEHTLTVNEMPSHTHRVYGSGFDNRVSGIGGSVIDTGDPIRPASTSSAGGGAAHNNMPPYLVVYIWRRTA